jgi:hypothetical protein
MDRKLLFSVNVFNKEINLYLTHSMLHTMYLDLKYWSFRYGFFVGYFTAVLRRQCSVEWIDGTRTAI